MIDCFYNDFLLVLQNLLKTKRSNALYDFIEEESKLSDKNISRTIKEFLRNTRLIILKHISILQNNEIDNNIKENIEKENNIKEKDIKTKESTDKINSYLYKNMKTYFTDEISYKGDNKRILKKLKTYHRIIHFIESLENNKSLSKYLNMNYNTKELELLIKRDLITKIKTEIKEEVQSRNKTLLENIIHKKINNDNSAIKIKEENKNELIYFFIIKKDIKNILKYKDDFIKLIYIIVNRIKIDKNEFNRILKNIAKQCTTYKTSLKYYYYTTKNHKYFNYILKKNDNLKVYKFIKENFILTTKMKYILLRFIIKNKNYKEIYKYIKKYKIIDMRLVTEEIIEYFIKHIKIKGIKEMVMDSCHSEFTEIQSEINEKKNHKNNYEYFKEFITTMKKIRNKKKINFEIEFYMNYLKDKYKYIEEMVKYSIKLNNIPGVKILDVIYRLENRGHDVSELKMYSYRLLKEKNRKK
ncbi:hypothetical protein SLOPH_1088 [Spraguea lophii 42_110]|uniref:Uncharacterized protein n=1 Tax=Spraguea lophii (strain 42_110) TaxID=1358809 RepID=S7W9Y2_SPRLO|nr:hypothetical protein SLOPH_1088 [Spraguea lophii 42_110]